MDKTIYIQKGQDPIEVLGGALRAEREAWSKQVVHAERQRDDAIRQIEAKDAQLRTLQADLTHAELLEAQAIDALNATQGQLRMVQAQLAIALSCGIDMTEYRNELESAGLLKDGE